MDPTLSLACPDCGHEAIDFSIVCSACGYEREAAPPLESWSDDRSALRRANRRIVLLWFAVATLVYLFVVGPAQGEVIVLRSGERIEGTIVERDENRLLVEVSTADGTTAQVAIPLDAVSEIRLRPPTVGELLARGEEFLAGGRTDEAGRLFEEARLLERGGAEAYHGLARVAREQGRIDHAIREARKGLLFDRSHPALHRLLGLLYLDRGDLSSGERYLERAAALAPFTALEALCRDDLARLRAAGRWRGFSERAATRRADFDADRGNNREATDLAGFSQKVVESLQPGLPLQIHVEMRAPEEDEAAYRAGGDLDLYRGKVRVVWFEARVDLADWAQRTRREQREVVGAWLRRASSLYPHASCVAVVRIDRRIVLEAVWSDLRDDVRFYQR